MAHKKHKFYNLLTVGPDMYFGHSPTSGLDYTLPDPGPDIDYMDGAESRSPGYKLGSYLNVYNFDDVINQILECSDWATSIHVQRQRSKNGKIWFKAANFLTIEKPEFNNIPRKVKILIQKGMVRGINKPLPPSALNNHWHYEPTGEPEDRYRGWWISDELKEILEERYEWSFYEDVLLEDNLVPVEERQYTDTSWSGGIEKTFTDVQYHDLRLALNDEYNLSGRTDNRAMGDRMDVVALFSYSVGEEATRALEGSSAVLSGSCDDGYYADITWAPVVPTNPDLEVDKYSLYVKRSETQEKELLALITHTNQSQYNFQDDLSNETSGVPGYPKYFISWKATEGSQSPEAEISKLPSTFSAYGVPSCSGVSANLELTSYGECFTQEYGQMNLSWNISLPENTVVNSQFLIKTLDSTVTEYEIDTSLRSYTDEDVVFESQERDVEYKLLVYYSSLSGGEESSILSQPIVHTLAECICDDDSENTCVSACWVRDGYNPEVTIWMDNYLEDPFKETPYASFKINYCIEDQCAVGISDFEIRLKLPEGVSITHVESEHGDISADADFLLGAKKDEWVIEPSDGWGVAKPSHGTLCKVFINKPIGAKRVGFIIEGDSQFGTNGMSLVLDGDVYDWSNNAQNADASPRKWQAGPPLSVCTGEVDMGYGDYLLDVQAVNLQTFDVNFCLSRDDFDTFVLVVLNTDFETGIDSVDQAIGRAVNAGWNVSHQNLSPGISLIMGNGSNPIASSGYETLLRAKLTEASIKSSEDSEDGSCVCVFPFFLKLGDGFQKLESMANSYNKNQATVQHASTNYSYALQTNDMLAASAMYAPNNMLVSGLDSALNSIDPRFREIVGCLKDAYDQFLENVDNPDTSSNYTAEKVYAVSRSVMMFMSMLSVFSTISVAKSDVINKQLDNIADLSNSFCNNYLKLEVEQIGQTNEFEVSVKYAFPAGGVTGVQFQINLPEEYYVVRNGLEGDAKRNKYLQCLGSNGAYVCVYDYGLGRTPTMGHNLLSTIGREIPDGSEPVLTSFKIVYTGDSTDIDAEDVKDTLIGFVVGSSGDYIEAKLVTNDILVDPGKEWNGNWFDVDNNSINALDFVTAVILTSGGDADLANPDSVIVLPDDNTVFKSYFGGQTVDLTKITYSTSSWRGTDSEGLPTYLLPNIDANQDGLTDITDLVTLRNLLLMGSSTIDQTQRRSIVPTEVCAIQDTIDYEFYVPDECSNFCITSKCLAKIWISDIIPVSSKEGTISDVLIEVSYASSCRADDGSGPELSLSGVQFTIKGLTGDGIVSCLNGDGSDVTVFKEKDWDYHIVPSISASGINDTIVAHATSENNYVEPSTGVLTYVRVRAASVSGETTEEEAYQAFTHTNSYQIRTEYMTRPESLSLSTPTALIGASGSSPMESMYATHQDTSEILALQRFGLKISAYKMTTNDLSEEANELFDEENADPSIAVELMSKNSIEDGFDADGDGLISLHDIQAAYHVKNPDNFSNLEEIVPTNCCPCDIPGNFKLFLADYSSGDELVLSKNNGFSKSVELSLEGLGCDGRFEGGVILAWTPSEDAKYYVVYRRPSGSGVRGIPIISSKVGVIANRNYFKTEVNNNLYSQVLTTPIQLDSTIWVDFPPTGMTECCDWCEDNDQDCDDATSSANKYDYYVIAYNGCGSVVSNKATGATPCCDFAPVASDDTIIVEGNAVDGQLNTFTGSFNVKTKPGKDYNVFTYTNLSGKKGLSEKGGKVLVGSGPPLSPSSRTEGTPNTFWYKYQPPLGFYGTDIIKFSASVESKRRGNWLDWCRDDGYIDIMVLPPNPKVFGSSGDCADGDERGTIKLKWQPLINIVEYKIYREGELIATVPGDTSRYTDMDAVNFISDCEEDTYISYAVTPVCDIDGQNISPEPEYQKIKYECCPDIVNPDLIINLKKGICNDSGDPQDGEILLFWKDLGNFDEYNVYRQVDNGGWKLIRTLSGDSDPDGFMRFYDKVKPCRGCHSVQHEYYVTTSTVSGEGEREENTVSITLDCCNTNPVAYDQEFISENGKTLIDKKLRAQDRDSNIAKYELLSTPDSISGVIYEFDEDTGVFSFIPRPLFYGETFFEWKVTDECGGEDIGVVTLKLEGGDYCNENDYIICNAAISYLTAQQDNMFSRMKDEGVPQVPFSLNNKGVPSLRKRCGSYSISQSIDPSLFALPQEGCIYVKFTTVGDPLIMPEVVITCEDETFFNDCNLAGTSENIPTVVISCVEQVSFSNCTGVFESDYIPPVTVQINDEDDN